MPPPAFERKLCAPDDLAARVAQLPHPRVFTNGCFDILHRGHVTYLAEARALGASLIVGVNSDASVKRQEKGDDRPINRLEDRMALLAALESVSLVIGFDADTPLDLILAIPWLSIEAKGCRRLSRNVRWRSNTAPRPLRSPTAGPRPRPEAAPRWSACSSTRRVRRLPSTSANSAST